MTFTLNLNSYGKLVTKLKRIIFTKRAAMKNIFFSFDVFCSVIWKYKLFINGNLWKVDFKGLNYIRCRYNNRAQIGMRDLLRNIDITTISGVNIVFHLGSRAKDVIFICNMKQWRQKYNLIGAASCWE